MCEANAYLLENETQTLLMEAVDKIEPDENGVRLVSIFGEQKFIKGHIYSMSLVDHKVYIKGSGLEL
ncbi:MAG: CooT family nickel-binding protein [Pseudomonadota bacterium]